SLPQHMMCPSCIVTPAVIIRLYIYYFDYYGDNRYLHSFPTRRSSDLRSPRSRATPSHPGARAHSGYRGHSGTHERRRATQASLRDRKSTRLNSSHVSSSYAVFCLKKKNQSYPFVMVKRLLVCLEYIIL